MQFVTRFAPSPTGDLHIGGVRTALFCWLLAKQHNEGMFRLRIEDTDTKRSSDDSSQQIIKALAWLQLDFQSPIVYQSQRTSVYHAAVEQLLKENKAYRCTCSVTRLAALRDEQMKKKQKPKYDGHCRNNLVSPDTNLPFVVRLKMPQVGSIGWDDLVKGKVRYQCNELDDLILLRSDNTPTYHLTSVVDDIAMNMTHIIRGDDHVNNTPRQIAIYQALNASVPRFAHVPMILGQDGRRLSKRHGANNVMQYKAMGVLPDALLNYLARLGWSSKDQEIFTRQQLIEQFNLEQVSRSAAAFDEEKLWWLNQQHIKASTNQYLQQALQDINLGQWLHATSDTVLINDILNEQKQRANSLVELNRLCGCCFIETSLTYDLDKLNRMLTDKIVDVIKDFYHKLEKTGEWSESSIQSTIDETLADNQIKMGQLGKPLRYMVTAGIATPTLSKTVYWIGKFRVLQRIADALKQVN